MPDRADPMQDLAARYRAEFERELAAAVVASDDDLLAAALVAAAAGDRAETHRLRRLVAMRIGKRSGRG